MPILLKTYQCGSPRKRGEGLRIGTVRYLPRGVKKENYASLNYFDVWLPAVAPSRKLLKKIKGKIFKNNAAKSKAWRNFTVQYKNELKKTEARQAIQLISKISGKIPVAIGCYCGDENMCHRSILIKIIKATS